MLAPSNYRAHPGLPLAIHPSELAASTFRALGSGVSAGADTGRVAGIVQDLVELVAKGYQALTFDETLASNVSFWPRVTSIVINDKAYAALSPAQRNALRNAGRAALGPAMQRVVRDERAALDVICSPPRQLEASFALLTASRSDRAALRDAAQPVYRELERDHATRDVIASIEAIKKHVTAEAAPRCPGSRLRRAPAPVRTLTITGDLTATDHTGWKGAVTSTGLGRGRLVLEGHLLFREFVTVRRMKLTARFRRGELHGCVYVATFDTRHGTFDWDGPGVIARASRPLRNYIGLSFRVAGVTPAGDLRHMRGGFVTDAPSGLPCRRGI
jgi:hypothetical protein